MPGADFDRVVLIFGEATTGSACPASVTAVFTRSNYFPVRERFVITIKAPAPKH